MGGAGDSQHGLLEAMRLAEDYDRGNDRAGLEERIADLRRALATAGDDEA